jgi:hypothetical protein
MLYGLNENRSPSRPVHLKSCPRPGCSASSLSPQSHHSCEFAT